MTDEKIDSRAVKIINQLNCGLNYALQSLLRRTYDSNDYDDFPLSALDQNDQVMSWKSISSAIEKCFFSRVKAVEHKVKQDNSPTTEKNAVKKRKKSIKEEIGVQEMHSNLPSPSLSTSKVNGQLSTQKKRRRNVIRDESDSETEPLSEDLSVGSPNDKIEPETGKSPKPSERLRQIPGCENAEKESYKFEILLKWIALDEGQNLVLSNDVNTWLNTRQNAPLQSKPAEMKKAKRRRGRPRRVDIAKKVRTEEANVAMTNGADIEMEAVDEKMEAVDEGKEVVDEEKEAVRNKTAKNKAKRARRKSQSKPNSPTALEGKVTDKHQTEKAIDSSAESSVASTKTQPVSFRINISDLSEEPVIAKTKESDTSMDSDASSASEFEYEILEPRSRKPKRKSAPEPIKKKSFDLEDPDVFVLESILHVRKEGRGKVRSYLVKWEGYDELTWEPGTNIPKQLIRNFFSRGKLKTMKDFAFDQCEACKRVTNTSTGTDEVIYLVTWEGAEAPEWEAKSALPPNVVKALEVAYENA